MSGLIGGGLLTLLIRTFLTERIKAQIQTEYNVKFETAKKELEKKATEHQIHYSKLHLERSEILRQIFEMLVKTEAALENLTTLFQGPEWVTDQEREDEAQTAYLNLEKKILVNRIYFSIDFLDQLDTLIKNYKDVIFQMSIARDQEKVERLSGNRTNPSPLDTWINLKDRVQGEIVDARKDIENDFRKLLGVD